MIQKLKTLWRPHVFQGKSQKGNYFEGWFFKLVDASQKNTFAFIPGVYIAQDKNDSHAFVMVLDGQSHISSYHPFPISEFEASTITLDIRVGPNRFRSECFELDIKDKERHVKGRITMGEFTPWPVKLFSPGVMGWYAFVPFMECYHGVISFDHEISGTLKIDNQSINFDAGRGYNEKDWGISFPSAYVWMQSNHFNTRGLSLMASVANIPWLRGSFRGFIIGLWHNGKLLRFTTYTGAELEMCSITENSVLLVVSDKKHRLELMADRTQTAVLHAPYDLKMSPKVSETLGSTIQLVLSKRTDNGFETVISDVGKNAGLDVNGNLPEIIS